MERSLYIDGIALWCPAWPGWAAAQPALVGAAGATPANAARPAPALLASNERRRAPDAVLVALEVATQALAGSGHAPAQLASVFTSAHGDLAIADALCRTLASQPLALSPTRFHHSVHNAASGYWAIGSGSQAASTALAAGLHSFGAGLLEAASQCACEGQPLLLVGCDTEAVGPMTSVNRSRGLLGVALVLAPARSAASRWQVQWAARAGAPSPPPLCSAAAQAMADNALADALPLFEALAHGRAAALALPTSARAHLALALTPL